MNRKRLSSEVSLEFFVDKHVQPEILSSFYRFLVNRKTVVNDRYFDSKRFNVVLEPYRTSTGDWTYRIKSNAFAFFYTGFMKDIVPSARRAIFTIVKDHFDKYDEPIEDRFLYHEIDDQIKDFIKNDFESILVSNFRNDVIVEDAVSVTVEGFRKPLVLSMVDCMISKVSYNAGLLTLSGSLNIRGDASLDAQVYEFLGESIE